MNTVSLKTNYQKTTGNYINKKGQKFMEQKYSDLTWLQKARIKHWFKKHQLHLVALQTIGAVDVIGIWNYTLYASYYTDTTAYETYLKILERYNEKFIKFDNVIFIL